MEIACGYTPNSGFGCPRQAFTLIASWAGHLQVKIWLRLVVKFERTARPARRPRSLHNL